MMLAHRKKRLVLILFLLTGASLVLAFVLLALDENLDFFYSPQAILSGQAPVDKRIRAGGMVKTGSLRQEGLQTRFLISDLQGHDVEVRYSGLLPDLFREGQGVVAIGKIDQNYQLTAQEILARHDENYMPPEAAAVLKIQDKAKQAP